MTRVQVLELLNKEWRKKKRQRPDYSMRALARDLKMDPSFLNRIFKGQKPLPIERISDFIRVLDIDDLTAIALKRALLLEVAGKMGLGVEAFETGGARSNLLIKFAEHNLHKEQDCLLDPWYKAAILDMVTLDGFVYDPVRLSARLGISVDEFTRAWTFLVQGKFILQGDDLRWRKSESKMRFATKNSSQSVRRFHKSLMTRAVEEMFRNTDNEAFSKRLITGATVAVNPEQIKKIQLRLSEVLLETCELATTGPCQEVYGINVSFFPLTKSR